MSDEVKLTGIVASTVTAVAVALIVSINWYYSSVAVAAINAGLSQKSLPGQNGVYWAKD